MTNKVQEQITKGESGVYRRRVGNVSAGSAIIAFFLDGFEFFSVQPELFWGLITLTGSIFGFGVAKHFASGTSATRTQVNSQVEIPSRKPE